MSEETSKTVRDRMLELQQAGLDLSLPAAPVVDPAPLGYIEVRAWKWRGVDGFSVRDGYEIGSRPRVEADGDAEYVIFKTPPPKPTAEETAEWPNWGDSGRLDPRIRRSSSPGAYRSLAETGGPNGHYNENVTRWYDKAE